MHFIVYPDSYVQCWQLSSSRPLLARECTCCCAYFCGSWLYRCLPFGEWSQRRRVDDVACCLWPSRYCTMHTAGFAEAQRGIQVQQVIDADDLHCRQVVPTGVEQLQPVVAVAAMSPAKRMISTTCNRYTVMSRREVARPLEGHGTAPLQLLSFKTVSILLNNTL